ncbi:VanZ family protein [Saccharopolyspora cebuensis]|uniref:VanZ family protein n=1 Tax=Saccharopolyspora cebuensis TaxID=418759 RepID=A0ABV4CP32_9PSEU
MEQIFAAFDGLVPAIVVPLVAALLVGAFSQVVRRWSGSVAAAREAVLDALLCFSALAVGFLVFTPQRPSAERFRPEIGTDFSVALAAPPGDSLPWLQLAGNLVLLMPLGMLVPMRLGWPDRAASVAFGGLVAACGIELVQFLAVSGRVASVDDVVLNTAGAALGGLLVRPPWRVPAVAAHGASRRGDRHTAWAVIERVERERAAAAHRP